MATRLAPPTWMIPRTALEQRLDDALTHRLTTMVAPTGAGKSMALDRWIQLVDGVRVPMRVEHRDLDHLAATVLDGLRGSLPSLPDTEALAAEGGRTASGGDPGRASALAAVITGAAAEGLRRHVALVLDDLDVLDGAEQALAFVEALVRGAPSRLHLVVASARAVPFAVDRLREAGAVLELTTSDLLLDDDELARWVTDRLGPDDAGLTAQVRQATGGWPALVHDRLDDLRRRNPEDRLASAGLTPADDLGALVRAQLSALPPPLADVLRLTLIAPVLRADVVQAAGGSQAAMDQLARHGLLVERDSRGLRPTRAVLPVLAESASLDDDRRTTLSEAVIAAYVASGDVDLALRAAGSAARPQRVVELLTAHADALARHPEQVIAAISDLPAALANAPSVRALLGAAHHGRGDWDAAVEVLRPLADTPVWDAGLALLLGFTTHFRGELEESERWCGDGWALAHPAAEAAHCGALLASVAWLRGDRDRCAALIEPALDLAAEIADDRALAAAHTVVAMLAAMDGDRRANRAHYRRALDYARRAGDALQEIRVLTNLGSHHLEEGEWDQALESLEEAQQRAETTGFEWFLPMTLSNRAHVLLHLGRLEESAADARRSIDLWERLGSRFASYPKPNLARGHALRGDRDTAVRLLRQVREAAERHGEAQASVPATAELAGLLAADDIEEAERQLAWARAHRSGMNTTAVDLAAARIAMARDDIVEAAARLEDVLVAASARGDRPAAADALTLQARLTGDPVTAERAIVAWRDVGNPIGTARATLELARLTDPPTSLRLRDEAAAAFHAVGCRAFDDELAAVGGARVAPDAIEIQALGRFALRRGGVLVDRSDWQSRKARDLLKILVAHRGQPVARDRLIAWLWPDDDAGEDTLRRRLYVQLSTLRTVLDPARDHPVGHHVASVDGALSLDTTTVDVDVERVLALADTAQELASAGRRTEALAAWQAADAATGGVFLAEDLDVEWAAATRRQVRLATTRTTMQLADDAAGAQRHDAAVRYVLRILEQDPYDEHAHLRLVAGLAAAGRHGEARRRYVQYTRLMAELGVEPAPYPSG